MTVPAREGGAPGPRALFTASALEKSYAGRRGTLSRAGAAVRAVDGVSFEIGYGETLGLVGESGSGKTTTGRLVVRLEEPTRGSMRLEGEDWLALSGAALRRRRRDVQVVFQDPQTSLNPRIRVGDQVAEPLRVQKLARGREIPSRVAELFAQVGLPPETAIRFPAELSGGQRQRVAIARALATRPRLLVCDEPVSALDVSIAAQIVNLFLDLRDQHGFSYLFISHDLAVVRRIADRIAVMYLGRIVEEGPASDVADRPLHPYTAALLSAVAEPDPNVPLRRIAVSSQNGGRGWTNSCAFAPRCPRVQPRCREETPGLMALAPERSAACFYPLDAPQPP
jgi:oligopeptide transport system ATP-binding protein